MSTNFLTGFEREKLQGLQKNYDCNQCGEPITNPICHSCLGEQVFGWLSLYPNIKKKIAPTLKKYIRELNNSAVSGINCVSCKNKKAALCPYCFTEEIFNMLKRKSVDKMVIMDYLSTFNFDLKHEGYIVTAAEEGLY